MENFHTSTQQTFLFPCCVDNFALFVTSRDGSHLSSLEESLAGKALGIPTKERQAPKTEWQKKYNAFVTWFEKNRLQIFWASLYTLVSIGIFAERAYCKSRQSCWLLVTSLTLLFPAPLLALTCGPKFTEDKAERNQQKDESFTRSGGS